MTAQAQHLQQKDFAHKLPKMGFQEQFVAINVKNISPTVFRKENQQISRLRKGRKPLLRFTDNDKLSVCAVLHVQVSFMHQVTKRNFL